MQSFYDQTGTEDETAWMQSEKVKELMKKMKARELDKKLCTAQAKRLELESGKPQKHLRRSYIKLFTTSTLGLGIKNTGAGSRASRDQSSFRAALFSLANQGPEPADDAVWCPIAGSVWPETSITAAHIFAWSHGQEMMTSIFGERNPPELFSPYNGLLISKMAERMLERGHIVIVPRLSDRPSKKEIEKWQRSQIKEYQIRVVDPTGADMQKVIFGREDKRKWFELERQPITFYSDFRPRARYLYFLYCKTMLKRSWNAQTSALFDELGKPYWGTKGSFMKKGMLLAFVEEMGHEYEGLLEGAMEDSKKAVQPDNSALFAANKQIISSVKKNEDCEESSDDDSEDDEDWEDWEYVGKDDEDDDWKNGERIT